ncbi:hypothetical protein SNEBB_009815 [Seison nebaliae]|nr:hypothetical protein SNEBB_009815 [Seison nebaliae]
MTILSEYSAFNDKHVGKYYWSQERMKLLCKEGLCVKLENGRYAILSESDRKRQNILDQVAHRREWSEHRRHMERLETTERKFRNKIHKSDILNRKQTNIRLLRESKNGKNNENNKRRHIDRRNQTLTTSFGGSRPSSQRPPRKNLISIRPKSAYYRLHQSKTMLPQKPVVYMTYNGKRPEDIIEITQQKNGGGTLKVFDGTNPKSTKFGRDFHFHSERGDNDYFGFSVAINGIHNCHFTTCCEFKYSKGHKVNDFEIVSIDEPRKCFNCHRKELKFEKMRKSKNLMKMKQTSLDTFTSSDDDSTTSTVNTTESSGRSTSRKLSSSGKTRDGESSGNSTASSDNDD